jgi:hypothetical protein
MAEPEKLIPNQCRFLRSKEMFIQSEPDPSVPSMRSGHFWCVHTQTVVGPDGKFVTQEDCSAERMCFESL